METQNVKRILVVEDEPGLLYIHGRMLQKHHFEVTEARNGEEAVAACENRQGKFDAILSDLNMPVLNGIELAKRNFEGYNLPFIACTSWADPAQVKDLLGYGVRDFLLKPAKEAQLVNVVHNAIGRSLRNRRDSDKVEGPSMATGRLVIASRMDEVNRSKNWLSGTIAPKGVAGGANRFAMYACEFIMNAYEHGNLGMTEELKGNLLESGQYEDELLSRETACKKSITIEMSFSSNSVAVTVADEGSGFDYNRYLKMSKEAIVKRLLLLNGRGIQMATHYFDRIAYSDAGAKVTLSKKLLDA